MILYNEILGFSKVVRKFDVNLVNNPKTFFDTIIINDEVNKMYAILEKKDANKTIKVINDICCNGLMAGTGKPEKLKYRPGYSRHINGAYRLEYYNENRTLIIQRISFHYED